MVLAQTHSYNFLRQLDDFPRREADDLAPRRAYQIDLERIFQFFDGAVVPS